jgi:NADPH-dependent curcumin reductase CurA
MTTNRMLVLAERPTAEVTDACFELRTEPVPDTAPAGQLVVRTCWLGFEPAMRGWLNDLPSYTPPVAIGEVMRAWGVGQVVSSSHPEFDEGSLVHARLGWQEYAVVDPAADEVLAVPADLTSPMLMLSACGLTGLTAYFGMTRIGRPIEGDTVLVTAAAGATGSVAGQIARALGARRVIGTAGTPEKRAWVRDVAGFDDCLDHYDDGIRRALRRAAPDGIDVVFDNVGGSLLDAALFNVANGGRIVLCGSISTGYRPERPEVGLHYYQLLTSRSARMEGFIVSKFADEYTDARRQLQQWVTDGQLRVEHDVLHDLAAAPAGLRRLFEGGNQGKQLLQLAEPH